MLLKLSSLKLSGVFIIQFTKPFMIAWLYSSCFPRLMFAVSSTWHSSNSLLRMCPTSYSIQMHTSIKLQTQRWRFQTKHTLLQVLKSWLGSCLVCTVKSTLSEWWPLSDLWVSVPVMINFSLNILLQSFKEFCFVTDLLSKYNHKASVTAL